MRMIAANASLAKGARSALLALAVLSIGATSAFAQLRGHGGPVRALAISPDGLSAISGSFDSTAIRWSLTRNAAEQVLRFHSDAVNAVAWLRDGRTATAGADGRIAIWTSGKAEPDAVLEGHTAPIVALAASPDGTTLASASWDHTVRLWPLAGGAPRVLEEHTQNVNGVAFAADGRASSASAMTRASASGRCPVRKRRPSLRCRHRSTASPSAAMVKSRSAAPTARCTSWPRTARGQARSQAVPRPVISIAISPDGAQVAAASIGGAVAVIDRKARSLARTLVGPGLPVWSVAFLPDGRTLLTGGADNIIRRWNAATGEPVDPALSGDGGRSAGRLCRRPRCGYFSSLRRLSYARSRAGQQGGADAAGIFGRRIATAPGYNFSDALKRLDIVWTPETVSKLFEVGPAGLYARHQDARAAHRLGAGPRRAGAISEARDQAIDAVQSADAWLRRCGGGAENTNDMSSIFLDRKSGGDRRLISLPRPCRWSWRRGGRLKVNANAICLWRRAGRRPRIRKSTDASLKSPFGSKCRMQIGLHHRITANGCSQMWSASPITILFYDVIARNARDNGPRVTSGDCLNTQAFARLVPNAVRSDLPADRAQPQAYVEGGEPAFSSWETAVTSCAGAKGLVRRMLLGTPFEGHSSALSPVM